MQIVYKLVEKADVFVTNLKSETKQKMGIDYEALSRLNPALIHANMTGFGPKGPLAHIGGYDPLGQAVSGMMHLVDSKEPYYLQSVILDQMGSILLSHSVLAALLARERQGFGQEVTVSLYSAALMLMQVNIGASSLMGKNCVDPWSRLDQPPLRTCYRCGDGKWIQGTNHPEQRYWPSFCRITGLQHLENDPRFAGSMDRIKNANELIPIIDEVMGQKSRDEWARLFMEAGLMFVAIQTLDEVVKDPQLWANDYMVDFEHPFFGTIQIPGYPTTFSASGAGTDRPAPGLGEHTDEILSEIGFSDSTIAQLKNSKAVMQKQPAQAKRYQSG